MAAFTYRAVDDGGRTRNGVIEATSAAAARKALRDRSLLPLAVNETRQNAPGDAGTGAGLLSARKISVRTLALITRQLATLIGGGARIDDALRIVADATRLQAAKTVLLQVRAEVNEGRSLAQALRDHPRSFTEFFCASVAAAEDSNRLGPVLEHLAEHVETRHRNRQTMKLALLYPALLAIVSVLVISLLLAFVVPDIARVFTSRGEALPLLTEIMIGLADGLARYGLFVLVGIALLIVAIRQWLSRPKNREAWHRALAGFRPTAGFAQNVMSVEFAGTLATLLQSGVTLTDALDASADAITNLHYRRKVAAAAARIREGASLNRAVTEADCFPPMLVAMIASGEASGALGTTLDRAAKDQQRELDAFVTTLVSLVEPGVLLLMGGFVLLMVLSILLPIINLNELAGRGI